MTVEEAQEKLRLHFTTPGSVWNSREEKIGALEMYNVLFNKNERHWGCYNTMASVAAQLRLYYERQLK